jgi:hypothetical protein
MWRKQIAVPTRSITLRLVRNELHLIAFGACAFAIRFVRVHGVREGTMRYWIKTVSVLLVTSALALPTLGKEPATARAGASKAPPTRMQIFWGPGVDECNPDCTFAKPVEVQVTEFSFTDSGGNMILSCLVTLNQEVHIAGKTGLYDPHRIIVWKLVPPSSPVPKASYQFQDSRGIVALSGDVDQISDGFAVGKVLFVVKHKNRKAKGQIAYYPLVEQVYGGLSTLCAAADPKITNDGG